jgi:hypothetical protein
VIGGKRPKNEKGHKEEQNELPSTQINITVIENNTFVYAPQIKFTPTKR